MSDTDGQHDGYARHGKQNPKYKGAGRRRRKTTRQVYHKSRQERAAIQSQKALDDYRDAKAASEWLKGLDRDLSWRMSE